MNYMSNGNKIPQKWREPWNPDWVHKDPLVYTAKDLVTASHAWQFFLLSSRDPFKGCNGDLQLWEKMVTAAESPGGFFIFLGGERGGKGN